MLNSIEESPLYKVANAKSIAFYGASSRPTTMGSIVLSSIITTGYEGKIYPIHPKEESIKGLKAYSRVDALPEVPDLVMMVLPTKVVCQAVEECGKQGVKQVIVVSGGFKEVGGDGIRLEKELLDIARKYEIRIVGPNCLGIANPYNNLNSTPLILEGDPGYVGLVSQSGSFVAQMYNYLFRLGLGFSTAFSVGNEADIDLIDCMEYLAVCPHTKVIALYIEGVKRGRQFMEAAKRISKVKPIVALYVGGSEAGKKAAFSHTGSLSGPDQLYDGMMAQCGITRAHSLTELFDICWALATLPRPKGDRVVVLTHSGGPGATAADSCSREGLKLPSISEETRENLQPFVPHTASIENPVDLTFTQNPQEYLFDIPSVLLKDETLDFLLIYLLMPENTIRTQMMDAGMTGEQADKSISKMADFGAKSFVEMQQKVGKPIVGFTYRSLQEKVVRRLMELGVPIYQDPARAVKAMKAVVDYHRFKDQQVRNS